MECLRDIGMEDEAIRAGNLESDIGPWYRFSNTMTSGELFRRFAFGNAPSKQVCCSHDRMEGGLNQDLLGRVIRGEPLRKTFSTFVSMIATTDFMV